MKLFLSKLLPLFTAGIILLCSVFALVPIESFAEGLFPLQYADGYWNDVVSNTTLFAVRANDSSYRYFTYKANSSVSFWAGLVYDGSELVLYVFCASNNLASARYQYGRTSSLGSNYLGNSVSFHGYFYVSKSFSDLVPSVSYYSSSSELLADSDLLFGFSTPSPEPTPTPTPAPTPAPGIDDFFRPFRSFSGAYYNSSAIYPPDSLTLNKYQQYTGLVSNKPIRVTDVRSNIDFLDDKVVYKFEYDFRAGATDSFDISVLYDADNIFGYDYAYITVGGETFDGYALSQSSLTGTYRVFGNADVPEALQGYTNWSWEHDLVNQKAISISGINLSVDDRVTLTVIVASSTLPHIPSSFDWSQFFQDTRPDNVFLATTGGLAALPFFISGLSFLALGALIGIILKFMR